MGIISASNISDMGEIMNNLNDLFAKYIEEVIKQSSSPLQNCPNSQQGLEDFENMIQNLGIDPNTIKQVIENTNPENPKEAIDTLLKEISKETTWLKPIKPNDLGFMTRNIRTRETKNGLEREVEKPLIIAACGKVIKIEKIGVKCSLCGQYDCREHALFCHHCGIGLCILHTRFYPSENGQNIPYCPLHYKLVIENQDTWGQRFRQVKKSK